MSARGGNAAASPRPRSDGTGAPGLVERLALVQRALAGDGGVVRVVETHMSWVFLGSDEAFKLKKPVRHPYLDFATLARREFFCREELRLNARLAPRIYLGLSTLRWDGCTLALCDEHADSPTPPGEVIEWLVRMRRLPEDRMLDRLIARGTLGHSALRGLCALLLAFYRAAPACAVTGDEAVALFERELAAHPAVLLHPQVTGDIAGAEAAMAAMAQFGRALARHADLLRARAAAGRIVEGHGDLRPEHVYLPPPRAAAGLPPHLAAPAVIDALEFNAALRRVDPVDELAYLGLECEVAGARWIGPWLLRRYAAALEPAGVPPALPLLYTAHRALLRARLAAAHVLDGDLAAAPAPWLARARRYLLASREAMHRLDALDALAAPAVQAASAPLRPSGPDSQPGSPPGPQPLPRRSA